MHASLKPHLNFIEQVIDHSEQFPDRLAIKFLKDDGTSECLSYGQLLTRIKQVTVSLQSYVQPGDRALLLYHQGLEFVPAFLGCLAAGVIAVPAYPPKRNRRQERIEGIVTDCQPGLILTSTDVSEDSQYLHELGIPMIATDGLDHAPPSSHNAITGKHPFAYLQYTSGSTSQPKGTILTLDAVKCNVCQLAGAIGLWEGWNIISWLPMHHDMGLVGAVLTPFYLGGRATLMAPATFLTNPFNWLKAFTTERGNLAGSPNFAFDLCVKLVTEEQISQLDLSSIRLIVNAAEPIKAETIERFVAKFERCGFTPEKMFPCFGLAEATLFVTGGPQGRPARKIAVDAKSHVPTQANGRETKWSVSCGVAAKGARVAIVAEDLKTELPEGTIGRIWSQSDSNGSGYWNNPELSQETFSNYLSDGTGPFLDTGDLGFLWHGELHVTGRRKDLIIARGRNIYPQDIERRVEQTLPFVESNTCGAFAVESSRGEQIGLLIEANRELVRAAKNIETDAQSRLRFDQMIEQLQHAVANEFELPLACVGFVRTGSFPRTSSGKVQRYKCRQILEGNDESLVFTWMLQTNPSNPKKGATQSLGKSSQADALIAWVRDYATRKINSRLNDERRCLSPNIVLDLGNQGFFGLQISKERGGLGLSTTDALRVSEQVAAIDPTLALMLGIHNGLGLRPINQFAHAEIQREVLPSLATGRAFAAFALTEPQAGSNPNAIEALARRTQGGWIVSGEKQWIGLGAWAGYITVIAKCESETKAPLGTIALLVRDGTKGLRHGPESLTMGARSIIQNSVYLNEVFVPDKMVLGEPGQGMSIAQNAMMFCRLGLAAISTGGMKRCAQLMLRYAQRRTIGTGLLLEHPVTRFRIGNLHAAIEAVQSLTSVIAMHIDNQQDVPIEAYVACKTAAPELFWQAADQFMQLLGGRGYIETNIAPQMLRDARLLRIFEGPTETLNAFLGARALHSQSTLQKLIFETFEASAIWNEFSQGIAKLPYGTGLSLVERQWTQHQAGELATRAILWAAAEHANQRQQAQGASVEWAKCQFFKQLNQVLNFGVSNGWTQVDDLEHKINGFETTIGNIEQELPGVDDQLDPLLRKKDLPNNSWKAHANLEIESTEPTPVIKLKSRELLSNTEERIKQIVLKWFRSEIDPNATSIDGTVSLITLGLDSVAASLISLDIESALGIRITPDIVYELPTIQSLAQYVDAQGPKIRPPTATMVAPVASPAPPANSITSRMVDKSALIRELVELNQSANRLRSENHYFYETAYERAEGPYVYVNEHKMLMMASFSYLGLIDHPEVTTATTKAMQQLGTGCHGVRLIAGTTHLHRQLEQALAEWMQADDAMLFSSGYSANVATIAALVGSGDAIFADALNHASLVDGCKLSGADLFTFAHNRVDELESLLSRCNQRKKLVVVDGVYSMEGDVAPLPEIVTLCQKYQALLMVDEAHSLGVMGPTGRGIQEHFHLPPDAIDIKMGNTSKALSSLGAFIAGNAELIDYLRHRARGYVFSTSLGPPQVAAALQALRILQREPHRVAGLQHNARRLRDGLRQLGFVLPDTQSAIIPLLCRTDAQAFEMTADCRAEGLYVIPIVYPAVPMNAARLRLNVLANHTDEMIDLTLQVLARAERKAGLL